MQAGELCHAVTSGFRSVNMRLTSASNSSIVTGILEGLRTCWILCIAHVPAALPFMYDRMNNIWLVLLGNSDCQSMTLHIELHTFPMHLQCISDSACYTTPHCPLHLCLCMCHPHLFVCLFVSPSRLFLLIDGQWTSAKSDCTHSIRRHLSRRLRSSLLLNSSPRCDLPCRIVY